MDYAVFTGGGTGGHILPGLAVAEVLNSKKDCKIIWIGASKGVDRDIVLSSGLEFIGIPAGKLRRYFSLKNITDVFKVIGGFIKSFFILIKIKPNFVFSKGGFVSVPPCAAAKLLGIPVITHECDFSPGLATRLNAKFANKILISYEETSSFFHSKLKEKIICTGNPVRLKFYNANEKKGLDFLNITKAKPVLLILGGSLGARQLNNIVHGCIDFLLDNFIVVHQAGAKNMEETEEIRKYISKNKAALLSDYKPFAFIKEEMADVLKAASIIVSRAGANTLWEAAAAGKPMILIPLEKGNSRGDQIENADFFEQSGAAKILTGERACASDLKKLLEEFLNNPEELKNMGQNSLSLASKKPAVIIADFLSDLLTVENCKCK